MWMALYIYTWGLMHFEYFFNLLLPVQYNTILFYGVHILNLLQKSLQRH